MHCPKCKSENHVKDGKAKGRQRYFCKNCRCHFSVEYKGGITPFTKRLALMMYLEGLGFRSIGRIIGVSNVTVLKWIRKIGIQFQDIPLSDHKVEIVEMDELWTFVGSKKKTAGSGLLVITWDTNGYNSYLATDR